MTQTSKHAKSKSRRFSFNSTGLNDHPPSVEREESKDHEAETGRKAGEEGTGREAGTGKVGEVEKGMEDEEEKAMGTEAQRIHTYHRSKSSRTGTRGHTDRSGKG